MNGQGQSDLVQIVLIVTGCLTTCFTLWVGYLLKRGNKTAATQVAVTKDAAEGAQLAAAGAQAAAAVAVETSTAAAVVAEKTSAKIDRVHAIVNGSSLQKDVRLEHKRLENRMLYHQIEKLRDQLLKHGIEPVEMETRVSPLEEGAAG